jgi:hypothetical protein
MVVADGAGRRFPVIVLVSGWTAMLKLNWNEMRDLRYLKSFLRHIERSRTTVNNQRRVLAGSSGLRLTRKRTWACQLQDCRQLEASLTIETIFAFTMNDETMHRTGQPMAHYLSLLRKTPVH